MREQKRNKVEWTVEQINKLLEVSKEHRLHPLFYTAMATGMRIGEILGLQWHDVQGSRLYVRRSLGQRDGNTYLSTTKTERSQRIVTVASDTLELLAKHKERQQAEYKYLGEVWSETEHVFTSELATVLDQRNVLRVWHNLQKKAEVPRAGLHHIRHMHVSLLIKEGIDVRTVADRVGHTNPAFTMKQYSHAFEEQRRVAAIPLTDLLGKKNEPVKEPKTSKNEEDEK